MSYRGNRGKTNEQNETNFAAMLNTAVATADINNTRNVVSVYIPEQCTLRSSGRHQRHRPIRA